MEFPLAKIENASEWAFGGEQRSFWDMWCLLEWAVGYVSLEIRGRKPVGGINLEVVGT